MDHWINGSSVAEIAPLIYAQAPRRRRKDRTVRDGLLHRSWVRDIQGALGPMAMLQYIDLWRTLRQVHLSEAMNQLTWRWTTSGVYTAKSCYDQLFVGAIPDPNWRLV